MPNWRDEVRTRIAGLGLEPTREAELVEELAQHLEDRYQELLARGSTAGAAAAAVTEEHLDPAALRAALGRGDPKMPAPRPVLGGGARGWFGSVASDLWFAGRSLRRSPVLVLTILLTLAIGIGGNVAVFSVVNALLFRPLPYQDPGRLVSFWGTAPEKRLLVVNYPDAFYDLYHNRARTIAPFAFYDRYGLTLSRAGESERVNGAAVTGDFFQVLGAVPLRGRTFLPEEGLQGANLVAVLSHRLWRRRFGGDPAILGHSIQLDETAATVVGVMPAGFDFPERAEVWRPLRIDPTSLSCWCYDAVGRLAPGQTPSDLVREIEGLNADFWADREGRPRPTTTATTPGTVVMPLARELVGDLRTPMLVLLSAVGMVMLIACANLAGLLLVRAVGRSREIAVRTALGASPGRIVRQLGTECAVLGVVGAMAGLAVGWAGVRLVEGAVVEQVTFLERIPLDPRVLVFTLAATVVTVLLFGLGPAIQGARVSLAPELKDGSRGTDGRATRRLNGGFVVGQLALSVILLTGAGLLLRSFRNLMAVDPGFQAREAVVARFSVPWNTHREMAQVRLLAGSVLDRVRAVSGVVAAGLSSTAPFGTGNWQQELRVEGQEPTGSEALPVVSVRTVSAGYFETIGTKLLEGRYFGEADRDSSGRATIIDESLARRYWPGATALGRRINLDGPEHPNWLTIIGVVASVRHRDLSKGPDFYAYRPLAQGVGWGLDLVVRSSAPRAATEQALRAAMAAVDPSIPLFDVHTLGQAVDRSLAARRVTNALLLGFAAAALVLAAIGVYGLMTRMVLARTREFGVRLALGASPSAVRALVFREGLGLVALGLTIGLVGAAGLSRFVGSLLFEVDPIDPITFVVVPVVLVVAAAGAVYLPARRATGVDPLSAIRAD